MVQACESACHGVIAFHNLPSDSTERSAAPMPLRLASRPPMPHFVQAADGQVLFAAGLWERWGRDDTDEPPFQSFTTLTHPNSAIPAPLTPDGPVFVSGLVLRVWLSGPQLLADAALRIASTPELSAYAVSHAHRDRIRSDYTLVEPRGARTI